MAQTTGIFPTLQRIMDPSEGSTFFNLGQIPGFPYTDWTRMQEMYNEYESWYSGSALSETITDERTGELVEKYPIKINPIPNTCEKHACVLLGSTIEGILQGDLPVRFLAKKPKQTETAKQIADEIEEAIKNAFKKQGGAAMFLQNGIISQYHGGCVFGVSYKSNRNTPDEERVQVFVPLPTEFIGIQDGTNPWELQEAWFVREISQLDAANLVPDFTSTLETKFFYVEKWTRTEYRITVNNKVVVIDDKKMEGPNPYKKVPFVYIPHLRIRGFFGQSIISESVKGIIKEMNLRFADVGDAVSEDAHTIVAVRNLKASLSAKTLHDGRKVTDLGGGTGITGNEPEPDMFSVRTESASNTMIEFGGKLENLYRKEVKHPAVADGEDQGSQRSSLTLITRMWPLVAHVNLERLNWTIGLQKLAEIILIINQVKKKNKIEERHLVPDITIQWALTLPRDREELINELAIRRKNNLGSLKHLLTLLDDVYDEDLELEEIKKDMDEDAERQKQLLPQNNMNSGGGNVSTPNPTAKANNLPKKEGNN